MDCGKGINKKTFCREWLENDNYKSFIKEVPDDVYSYFCSICEKKFSCNSLISRHVDSQSHRKKVENCSEETKTKQCNKREFCQPWLENKRFKPWLKEIPNDPLHCFCSFCNCTFRCGRDALLRHSDTKKHISECQKRNNNIDLDTHEEESSVSFENRKKVAEIKFAALIAETNIPFSTAETILNFFQDIGKDPEILQSMTMHRKKAPLVINKVLCTREQERSVEQLRNTKFSVYVDETSDITNQKWMTFLVRYVEPRTLNVRTELLELIHLDASDCSADKLFNSFRDIMWKKIIPFQNILALSCDNASVMTGKYNSFKVKLEEYCKNLVTMPCPCHAAALVANAACTAIPSACEEFLRKVASFISSSPKRACIFRKFQDMFTINNNRKILKLSETRWLSRHLCVTRINENWDALLQFLQDQSSEKSKSGADLVLMMRNPEIQAYLLFLEYVLDDFNKFNAFFQSRDTKVHLLQSAAENLLKTVCRNVVKPRLLDFVNDSSFDILLPDNRRFLDQVLVGQDCQDLLDRLDKEGHGEIVKSVYANCLSFYDIAAKEIREKLFVKEEFLNKLKIFDPKFILRQGNEENKINNSIVQDVLFVAKRLGGFDEEMLEKEWQSFIRDFSHEQQVTFSKLNFDDAWKTVEAIKDAKGKCKYVTIMKLVNAIRSLPNSNAEAERMFSMLTDVKTKKRNKLSPMHLQALCVFKTNLKARGETARTMRVDARHLALMTSDNLYQTMAKNDPSSSRLFDADDSDDPGDPSTSSDL